MKDQLIGEVFEMLLTFTDFNLFKELMLDYKKAQSGAYADLSLGISVCPLVLEDRPTAFLSTGGSASSGDN